MKDPLFRGKTALVTGATSGIGKAFAEALARQGANLVITARNKEVLDDLALSLEQQNPMRVHPVPMDLAQPGAADALYRHIQNHGIHIDLLVNNAGFGRWSHFHCEDITTYRSMIDLNVTSLVELSRLFIQDMLQAGEGGIINVASIAAHQPVSYQAVYAASKSFVLSFTEALAGEYNKRGIHCLALCPGNTTSNFMATAHADTRGMSFASPDDVVKTALRAYGKRKSSVVHGRLNYLISLLPRLLPRQLTIGIAGKTFAHRVPECAS
jgi:short-subunit dehydrogenase